MKNKTMHWPTITALFLTNAFLTSFASADVTYYNYDSGKTYAFYVEGQSIFRQECPSMVVVNNRVTDCKGAPSRVVSLADADQLIVSHLGRTVSVDGVLSPLTDAETNVLQSDAATYSSPKLAAQKTTLTTQQQNFQQLATKLGSDASLDAKISANTVALAAVEEKIAAISSYATTYTALVPLIQPSLDLIVNAQVKKDFVASALRGTLQRGIFQVLAHAGQKISGRENYEVGENVIVDDQAICHDCSEEKSKPFRGISSAVTQVTQTYEGKFVQLVVEGVAGWWLYTDVYPAKFDWSN